MFYIEKYLNNYYLNAQKTSHVSHKLVGYGFEIVDISEKIDSVVIGKCYLLINRDTMSNQKIISLPAFNYKWSAKKCPTRKQFHQTTKQAV